MRIAIAVGERSLGPRELSRIAAATIEMLFGLMFMGTGLAKYFAGTGTLRRMLGESGLFGPDTSTAIATWLPGAEIALGLLLLAGLWPRIGWGLTAVGLIAGAFVMVQAWAAADGGLPCGCQFALAGDTVASGVVRNLILLLLFLAAVRLRARAEAEREAAGAGVA